MLMKKYVSKILLMEVLGFAAITVLSWVDETSELPHLIDAARYISNWRESALETLVVVIVAGQFIIIT